MAPCYLARGSEAPLSVKLTREGAVAVVAMDDGKANALRASTLADLDAALDDALAGGARALVLAGRPGYYSAGLDLKFLPALPFEEQVALFEHFARVLLRLYVFPLPTVAAVTGHAMAGGALLALAQDVRIGAEGSFRFALNEVAIGLPMPTFGIEVLRGAVPRWAEAELLLHGRAFTLAEARDRRVFEDLEECERVTACAVRRAAGLAKIPHDAYALTKERLRRQGAESAMAALDGEVAHFMQVFRERFPAQRS